MKLSKKKRQELMREYGKRKIEILEQTILGCADVCVTIQGLFLEFDNIKQKVNKFKDENPELTSIEIFWGERNEYDYENSVYIAGTIPMADEELIALATEMDIKTIEIENQELAYKKAELLRVKQEIKEREERLKKAKKLKLIKQS